MNQRKAKAMRKLAEHISKGLPAHSFKEMGMNTRMVDGKAHRITAPVTVAADTQRGQYRAIKRMIKQSYGSNA